METWLSGRKRLTANEVGFKSPPGFESLRLRRLQPTRDMCLGLAFVILT